MKPIIIVHGGAGSSPQSRAKGKLDGVNVAVGTGYELLLNGYSALDAVEAAIVSMEDDEYFNAGYGSDLNVCGEVEMEASIMSGTNLDVGAVTLVKDFRHPISIARKVLTDSVHNLIGGEAVKKFALEKGFEAVPRYSLICKYAQEAYNEFLERKQIPPNKISIGETVLLGHSFGTVGAVAVDSKGRIVAATSTGGVTGKAVGRIGHTPLIGSGTYADDNVGGVSSTGHGESIAKYCLSHSIIKLMEGGLDADTATKESIIRLTARLHNVAGSITLSKNGDVGVYFTAQIMPWAYVKNDKIFYGIQQGEIFENKYL